MPSRGTMPANSRPRLIPPAPQNKSINSSMFITNFIHKIDELIPEVAFGVTQSIQKEKAHPGFRAAT